MDWISNPTLLVIVVLGALLLLLLGAYASSVPSHATHDRQAPA